MGVGMGVRGPEVALSGEPLTLFVEMGSTTGDWGSLTRHGQLESEPHGFASLFLPALGLQVHTTMLGFYVGSRDKTWFLMLAVSTSSTESSSTPDHPHPLEDGLILYPRLTCNAVFSTG